MTGAQCDARPGQSSALLHAQGNCLEGRLQRRPLPAVDRPVPANGALQTQAPAARIIGIACVKFSVDLDMAPASHMQPSRSRDDQHSSDYVDADKPSSLLTSETATAALVQASMQVHSFR